MKERGIAWRCSDSLALRSFLCFDLDEQTPDHSSLSRIRHRIDLETHEEIFTWVLKVLSKEKLLEAKTLGIDATTLGVALNADFPPPRTVACVAHWHPALFA